MKKLIITAVILTMTFSVNAQSWWKNSKKVKGDGNVKTEIRNTQDYDGVSVGGFFDVVLVKGTEGKIKIEGEGNLLEYIETEVKKGSLKIRVKKGFNLKTTRRLTVTVPVKSINRVSIGGSGNVTSNMLLKANNFKVSVAGSGNVSLKIDANSISSSVAGSGDVELSGEADSMKCSIAGSGDIKAYELNVNSLKASIAGSGSIRISVEDEIKATVAGSGSIYYKGNPGKKDIKSAGSGRIVNKN